MGYSVRVQRSGYREKIICSLAFSGRGEVGQDQARAVDRVDELADDVDIAGFVEAEARIAASAGIDQVGKIADGAADIDEHLKDERLLAGGLCGEHRTVVGMEHLSRGQVAEDDLALEAGVAGVRDY